MNDENGQAQGMCAAYGCPLFGTLGSDGRWYCFCHVNKPSVFNDAITRELRERQLEVVEVTLAIRRDSIHGNGSRELSVTRSALKNHPLGAELGFSKKDGNASGWLLRLERHLIEATADIGTQKRMPATVATAPVIGPTHAMQHYTEPQS